jgi:choline dehydrogenase-like flavoprotein
MSNLNIKSQQARTYDAIVIGSGASGGWAAKEFTGKGLRTLVLERGRDIKHIEDYPTTMNMPWQFEHRGKLPKEIIDANPIISKCYAFYEGSEHMFTKDAEQPYVQETPFDWIRGYHTGGKSLMWARWVQRWSQYDFDGPQRDGFATPWPIGYKDIAPWYDHVEKFIGVSGYRDGLDTLPDGIFQKPFELNCVEQHFKDQVKAKYGNDRHMIISRVAHLTEPKAIHLKQGRGTCQNRTICERGCPFGGYFSSNSSTLPWAAKTGKMTLRPHSIVHSIIYDERKKKAVGVKVLDANTGAEINYYARIIFVNASALASNMVLLNSKSNRFENGLGNDNGLLGKYAAFHNYSARIYAEYDGHLDKTTEGRKPSSGYIPRFRNVYKQETDFLRGYAAGFFAERHAYQNTDGLGADLKNNLHKTNLTNWKVNSNMMGETIPKETNYIKLDETLKDPHGMPQARIHIAYDENDAKMKKDFFEQMTDMYTKAGFTNIRTVDTKQAPGLDIHEMGGVRMGADPKTSMLNRWNQMHYVKNVFVTDGACMTSTSTQNPTLTYMALTARAVDYAVKQMAAQRI